MIKILQVLPPGLPSQDVLALPFELRRRSRLRSRLESGQEVGLFLPRGIALREGDLLKADNGRVVRIRAAPETVSCAHSTDPLLLARASYHLGNRHVALQIEAAGVRYLHDHVLDDMVRSLGLTVTVETLPFEPEVGAYGGHSHGHSHDDDPNAEAGHGHDHNDRHSHDHGSPANTHPHDPRH